MEHQWRLMPNVSHISHCFPGQQRTFKLSSAAEPINFTTPGYPVAPKELSATHITPEEIHLQWKLPRQNGSDILGMHNSSVFVSRSNL